MPISPDLQAAVVLARLHLYNHGQPCGAAAVRRYLDEQLELGPLPSTRCIHTLLTLYGLTHRRTGWYDGEQLPVGVPSSAWVPPAQRRYVDWDTDHC